MKTISGILIVLVLEMTLSVLASPFLYNAAPLFLQSIVRSSAGISDNGTQNVEDLRNSDEPSKLDNLKAERRQHFARQQADESSNANEAVPNFFQKKIDKILYKLRLISQLSGPFNFGGGGGQDQHTNKERDDFDVDFDSGEKNDTVPNHNSTEEKIVMTTIATESRPQRFSLHFTKEQAPLRGGVESEQTENNLHINVDDAGTTNKVNMGTIGVFLVEMLGTVLTLIYGAAVQNNNENNTTLALI